MDGQELYLIAIMPPVQIAERVHAFKEEFAERFNSSYALKVPVHITLIPPVKMEPELMEENVSSILREFAASQKPFPVALKNFQAFKPRVVYVDIEDQAPLKALRKDLAVVLRRTDWFPAETLKGPFHPHMTIAYRDLKYADFQKAWEEFSRRKFSASFQVDHITLLRHTGLWEVQSEFKLGALSQETLFG